MKILFIGGNGNISWWCVQIAIEVGHTCYVLNREETLNTRREIQPEVIKLKADIRNKEEVIKVLKCLEFDCVIDFICYNEEHAKYDIELFKDITKQFIYISSVTVYKRETKYLPFKENTPQWGDSDYNYALDKVRAEKVFINAFEKNKFPITIVRPAHTYDTILPVSIGHNCFTAYQRYLEGRPALIAGDGTNLWTLTHSKDFAEAFIHLIGNDKAIGEDFHITGDEWLTWLEITDITLNALNIHEKKYIHIPIEELINLSIPVSQNLKNSNFGQAFVGYRMWCDIYDNTKIKKIAPSWKQKIFFKEGIKYSLKWMFEKDVRRRINKELYNILNDLTDKYKTNIVYTTYLNGEN
ncbi:NAD-dependent epimerase/dehydratase family protein [Brachyspira hyodysenteriae]|uniref:NAD-dependent epimerase/dehydratase family protein n=1 Tax=Brachyspira hyodysenteriae TaxID=159 RepID=UPI00063DA56B|nr:NAD-dependent epimerase/dehydratase family protein [Brachyspira hyodysenteriae]